MSNTKSCFKLLFSLYSSFQSVIIQPKTGLLLSRCLFFSCSLFPFLSRVDIIHSALEREGFLRIADIVWKELYVWPVVWMLFIIYTELLTLSLNVSHFKTVPHHADSP